MSFLAKVKRKDRKIWRIVIIALAALALVIGVVVFLKNTDLFYKKIDTHGQVYKLTDSMNEVVADSDLQKGYMYSRTLKLLMDDRGSSPFILDWYVMPGTTRSVPGYQSQYVDTYNQVLLLESYVLEGKKSKAETLMKAIEAQLVGEDGYLVAYAKIDSLSHTAQGGSGVDGCEDYEDADKLLLSSAPASLKATSTYLGVLMDYYDKWGDEKLLTRIKDLAAVLFETQSQTSYKVADRAAMPTPIPVGEIVDPVAEPEEEDEQLVSQDGIELSGIDLMALKRACAILPEYQEEYDRLVDIVSGGIISETLPLYAWMYEEGQSYTYYAGSSADVDLVPSLYAIVHLAEVGKMDPRTYAWIQSQMYNSGFLYTKYNMFTGEAGSEEEAYEAYPLVLYLAVIQEDENLFNVTYQAIMRQYATLSSSEVLYTVYRDVPESRIAVYARENLWMELLLR